MNYGYSPDEESLLDIEQSVIGAVLLRADNLALLPTLEVGDFKSFAAQEVWTAIRNLEAKNRPIDIVTVGDEIALRIGTEAEPREHKGHVYRREASVWAYLADCTGRVPTTDNAIEYARRVKDHALRRRLVLALGEVLDAAKSTQADGAELLSLAMAGLSVLDAETPESAVPVGEILKRRLKQLDGIIADRISGKTTLTGFPTGVEKLDEVLGGWQAGIVSIIAARPGMGKSSMGLATADASTAAGFGVHLFSLEDTDDSYADRVMSRTSQVPAEQMRNAQLNRGEMECVSHALAKLHGRKNWLVDGRSGITAEEIVRSVRRHRKQNGTRLVIVDYVQLVKPANGSRLSRHESLTEIVTTFADAAKHDGLAYVVMSQLNRDIEKREDRRPQLADLRESGSLEERAKCVVGMYRGSEYYATPRKGIDYPDNGSAPDTDEFRRTAQLLVLKNSNGRKGRVFATFDGATTRIS